MLQKIALTAATATARTVKTENGILCLYKTVTVGVVTTSSSQVKCC